jgi:hypothetical protein
MIFNSIYEPTEQMQPKGKLMCMKNIKQFVEGFDIPVDPDGGFDWDDFVGRKAIIQTKQKKDIVSGYESLDIVKVKSL